MGRICTIEGCNRKHHAHGRCRHHNYVLKELRRCSICGFKYRSGDGYCMQICRDKCYKRESQDTFGAYATPNPVAMLSAPTFCRIFTEIGLDCDELARIPAFRDQLSQFALMRIGLEELILAAKRSKDAPPLKN